MLFFVAFFLNHLGFSSPCLIRIYVEKEIKENDNCYQKIMLPDDEPLIVKAYYNEEDKSYLMRPTDYAELKIFLDSTSLSDKDIWGSDTDFFEVLSNRYQVFCDYSGSIDKILGVSLEEVETNAIELIGSFAVPSSLRASLRQSLFYQGVNIKENFLTKKAGLRKNFLLDLWQSDSFVAFYFYPLLKSKCMQVVLADLEFSLLNILSLHGFMHLGKSLLKVLESCALYYKEQDCKDIDAGEMLDVLSLLLLSFNNAESFEKSAGLSLYLQQNIEPLGNLSEQQEWAVTVLAASSQYVLEQLTDN